jgi:hypothetical protein
MLLNDIARRLNPHLEWNAPPRQPRPAPEFRCEMFDLIAAHHEAGHACWNFFHGTPIYDVQINGEGLGGGEFRATPGPKVELSDGNDVKQRAKEDLRIMAALVDENTREEWLRHLPGFACPKYAQHLFGARGAFYDAVCEHDYLVIDRVLNAITRDPETRRRYRAEIEHRAKVFVVGYWREITRLANEIFKHGRLDREQIEAVLAPPPVVPRAMPRRPGDEPNFFRRCDGFVISPKKS